MSAQPLSIVERSKRSVLSSQNTPIMHEHVCVCERERESFMHCRANANALLTDMSHTAVSVQSELYAYGWL